MDHQFHPILIATNRGNGAYVCTVEDLRQDFVKPKLQQSLVNWSEPSITIYYPNSPVKTTMAEISNGDENYWAMPAIFKGESLSTQQQERAREARELHNSLVHPGDKALSLALDNGNLIPTRVTSQDIRNANTLLGPCIPCLQSKMKAPTEKTSNSPPAHNIGDNVHADIIPITTSVGGNNFILFTVDERSDYIIGIPMATKSQSHLVKAIDVISGIYLQKGHTLSHLTTDNENNLRSMEHQLRTRKISLSTTPAGLHEKKAERTIQTIKRRLGATKAALSYVLPSILEAEAYITVIRLSNVIPTKNTGTRTPYEIFHNEKPQVPTYSFGTIAL